MFAKKNKSTKELVHGDASAPEASPKKEKPGRGERGAWRPRTKVLLGILCVAAGLLIAFVAAPAAQERTAAVTSVVALARDVEAGTLIADDMLSVIQIGVSGVPGGAIADPSEAVGQYMRVAGLAGDVLTAARLSSMYPTEDPELLSLPEGKVAMAVSLDSLEQSVASKLRSGDVIQLFAVLNDTMDASDDTSALVVPELRAVEVLSVTNSEAMDVTERHGPIELDGDEDRQIAVAVLAVEQRQASVLSGLAANAKLHAALVSRGDAERKAALLAAQKDYFTTLAAQEEKAGTEETPLPEGGETTGEGGGEE